MKIATLEGDLCVVPDLTGGGLAVDAGLFAFFESKLKAYSTSPGGQMTTSASFWQCRWHLCVRLFRYSRIPESLFL